MTSVDTNIVVRLLTADDPKQFAKARRLFHTRQIWISKTVILETAWVLKSLYRLSDDEIRSSLSGLCGLKNVQVEDERSVAKALALMGHSMDLADAMHLSSRPDGVRFVSFDRALVKRARRAGVVGISEA